MRNINGKYYPCVTEIKKAQAHARAIERKYPQYSGYHVELWFNHDSGTFHYYELSQNSYMQFNKYSDFEYIPHTV